MTADRLARRDDIDPTMSHDEADTRTEYATTTVDAVHSLPTPTN